MVSAMLSKKPAGAFGIVDSLAVLLRLGRRRICAFQSVVSRKRIRMAARRRTGWSVRRFMKRWRDQARRCVNSVLNLSPRTYAMLFFSGSGGTAQAGYSRWRVWRRNTKSVNRRRTENSDFWNDLKSVYKQVRRLSNT
jgi:hypothetical protein